METVEMAEVKFNRTRRLDPRHEEKVTSRRKWYLEDQPARNLRGQAGMKRRGICYIDPTFITPQSNGSLTINGKRGGYQTCYSQMALMLQLHIPSTSLQTDDSHTSTLGSSGMALLLQVLKLASVRVRVQSKISCVPFVTRQLPYM